MHEASYYEVLSGARVVCTLCPHRCVIGDGEAGRCGIRQNVGGRLMAAGYGKVVAKHCDPIEKKPLADFYPGHPILSVGSVGCNISCSFCQNWSLSRRVDVLNRVPVITPEALAAESLALPGNLGVAYTYNEPIINFEFIRDCARVVRANGQKNVLVTNGYVNQAPLLELIECMDAFSVDLKGSQPKFFEQMTHSKMDPYLDTLRTISASGKHLEVVYLVIPGANDHLGAFKHLMKEVSCWLPKETVWHINRYFPAYECRLPMTPIGLLKEIQTLALGYFERVYIGNV